MFESLFDNDPLDLINMIRITGIREHEILTTEELRERRWDEIQGSINEHTRMLRQTERHTRQKAIQDPVHGAIIFDPWELDLISSWEMLRLRYVRQLGPAHLVYPGATHSRFEHCLGTSFLAQKCIRVVTYCDDLDTATFVSLSDLLDPYHQKLFRAVCLLHDVGHPPTSHTIEFALESYIGLSHIDLGEFLILHSGVNDILERHNIEPRHIVDILKRRTTDPIMSLISDFIDSPLDIDKTDYLIRDAHFSGVQLGIFPADLYFHHAVRVAEALTSKATYFRMKEDDLTRNECIGLFTRMTDGDLYRWLERSETDFIRDYAARIRYRHLFKVVTARPIALFEDEVRERISRMEHDIERLIEAELELNETPGTVIIDIVDPPLGAYFLSKIPVLAGGETGFDMVQLSETEEGKPLMQLLKQQQKSIPSVRVYSDPSIANNVRKRFEKLFPSSEKPSYREDDYDLTEY